MDIFITDSPYYCLRGLCSPCAPNAGHLKTDGNYQTYCLAAECYEVVPFDIYCVKTGELMAKAGSIVVE